MKNDFFLYFFLLIIIFAVTTSCTKTSEVVQNPNLVYERYSPKSTDRIISREDYYKKLQGFWLGTCIANWTGLVTISQQQGVDFRNNQWYVHEIVERLNR